MKVVLPPELERFVQEKVAGGEYPSHSAVVEAALLRLKSHEAGAPLAGEDLSRLIAVGQHDADQGNLLDSDAVREEIRQRSAARRASAR